MTISNLGRITIVPKGNWVAGNYKPLDLVRYNNMSYLAKVTTSALPTNATDWTLIVSDGLSLYTWVKYSDDEIGTGLSNSPVGKSYIGIATNKSSATESTVAADYEWILFKGNSSYTWIKYADDNLGTNLSNLPTGKLYVGIATNKAVATESELAADYEWSLLRSDPFYTWIKYATSDTGTGMSDSPTGMTHIGIAVNKTTAIKSTTASDYTWSLIKGSDGVSGVTTGKSIAMAMIFGG